MLSLIKLQNGIEMIGNVKEEQSAQIVVEDPLQINYRMVATQPMPTISVSRYMPFADTSTFTFDKKDILHVVEPKIAMVKYYKNALLHYEEVIDQNISDELVEACDEDDQDQTPISKMSAEELDEAYKALLERINLNGPPN